MKPTRRTIRRLGAAVASVVCLAVWQPDHVEAQTSDLVTQGRQALDADRVDDAIEILQKAVTADATDPAAVAWLGSAQVRKARTVPVFDAPGWVKKGFHTLDEAVERFPDAFIVYVVRGITGAHVPDLFRKAPGAVKDLSTVLAMREKNPSTIPDAVMPSVYLNLGRAYKKNGQPAEARAAWETGKRAYPSARETHAIDKELQGL